MENATTQAVVQIIQKSNLGEETELALREGFVPFIEQAEQWKQQVESLVVTDESQTELMEQAKKARLELRTVRTDSDKLRKKLKEDSLRYGKTIQGIYNAIEGMIKPLEEHLLKQEKYAENKEAERKAALEEERLEELQPLMEYVPYGIDLGSLQEEEYKKVLDGAKFQKEAADNRAKREEEERLEQERIEKLQGERIQKIKPYYHLYEGDAQFGSMSEEDFNTLLSSLQAKKKEEDDRIAAQEKENERLRKEIEEQNAKEAKLKAELEAKQKAEQEEEEKRKRAGDKEKFNILIEDINSIVLPTVKSKKANKLVDEVGTLLGKVTKHIEDNM